MNNTRIETDSLGEIDVPAEHLWGAQTERSRRNFVIGEERMPKALLRAFALQKLCAARANYDLGVLDRRLVDAIVCAAREVLDERWSGEFPLSVWQTGSGTQTNMNFNEVLANRANELLGGERGSKTPVHPNDHVNCSQSSNDSMPTAMHIAAVLMVQEHLVPSLVHLQEALKTKEQVFNNLVKIGRTHFQDAVPLTLGQEFSGYAKQVENGVLRIEACLPRLYQLAQGGTAVGTGLNSPPGFAMRFVEALREETDLPFVPAENRFEAQATHDALVELSGALNTVAVSLHKIARDFMLLASGPRCGFAELILPANEPGSSIMPGKVNPTQAEALAMVCVQTMGNHAAISIAGTLGCLELNAYKPVIAANLLQSLRLLSDAASSFTEHCVRDVRANESRLADYVARSPQLATALNAHIGYDKAAKVVQKAIADDLSLREAMILLGYASGEDFDCWVDAGAMARLII